MRNLYRYLNISHPNQLDINKIANKLNLTIHYGSTSFRIDNELVIKRSTKQKEWQLFGHEVGHYLIHVGNHYFMHYLFRDLQEWQANLFAYHFCVPTFMLDNLYKIIASDIMNLFNVEFEFARKRLEMYERKVIDERLYHQAW
ncbi:ImmA/IrrE family metallo-endopeptidase [Lentibacillus sp.]|uniref:ImmA/IrrE family metallo-endopeptidase n=1 Tax=Lentibacillus sp. TaxID=1925746 RepID=UPI002B4B4636|nr:ImmA/IrrE family metallo-endopeptidase [Lentibacillus sp.]HLS10432.1 ImmA/IrrE family metallo-endopeptidase [Lentibacillus sp.]